MFFPASTSKMADNSEYFRKILEYLKANNLYPDVNIIDGPSFSPELVINGKKILTFCSNNYLGLAGNDEVKRSVATALEKYGVGSASTRLLSGTLDVQVEFEKRLADFYGVQGAITFSSGYLANIGCIRMLVDPFPYIKGITKESKGIIFSDALNHASIVDAIRLSKSEKYVYKHNDLKDLEANLKKYKKYRKLIVTDGVFSMDGDLAALEELTVLSRNYGAILFVDDSHGSGVLGPHGEGTAYYKNVADGIDVTMGSFTKAWGSLGGFVVCKSHGITEYLKVTARSFIFSDPILPAVVAGLIKTLEIIMKGDALRATVLDNANYLRNGLNRLGYEVTGSVVPIIPVILFSEKNAIDLSRQLFSAGILAPAIRRPAVPVGRERLRLTVMATHTRAQIDKLLTLMEKLGKECHIIN